ncbi:MAG: nucleotidyltransferase domain-containing protein [Olegusella sp.]|nr:nucleotidyltransferase domain-containing protein [Olegusella sp.]
MATASMTQALPAPVVESIQALAQRCGIKRVRLFGSRARGDNRERSDIDLAVSGGNVAEFSCDIDYETPTLLMFDVVDLDKPVNPELLKSINRDGIDIYVGE